MSRVASTSLTAVLALVLALSWGCSSADDSDSAASPEGAAIQPDHWLNDPLLPEPPDVEVYAAVENSFTEEPEGMDDPRVEEIQEMAKVESLVATPAGPETVASVLELGLAEPVLPAVQEEAIDALENLGWKGGQLDGAVEAIGKILEVGEPRVRARAIEALDFLKSDRSTELLIGALSDPHPQVRSDACSGLLLRVRPEHHEPVKAAYLKEEDRTVKVDLWELLENIAVERQKMRAAQGADAKDA